MAVTISNADKALKTYYLDVVAEQLNTKVNPFLSMIKQSTDDVWGKEVKKLAICGVNGGIGAGTEDGDLPTANGNNYEQFTVSLKNLYGTIEISDKAIRASENNAGAFVSLLNAEMEGLLKSSTFNFGRMLFGDGTGAIATVVSSSGKVVVLESVKNVIEGMVCDIMTADGDIVQTGKTIGAVDRKAKTITFLEGIPTLDAGMIITVQGSYGNEITGLKAIFNKTGSLYGLDKESHGWLKPYIKENAGTITELDIQTAIDEIEEESGSTVNVIVCSWGVRRALQKLFSENRRSVDTVELSGGYKAMSYNGIPVIADRFCPEGTMYLLNTEDFTLHQLCDWQWLEGEDGKVLKQVAGKPVYTATLVKYADLMCARPNGQGMISGITEE